MRRWHVVQDESASDKGKRAKNWTVSRSPKETGWETDCGFCTYVRGYGLTHAQATELADAANNAWEWKVAVKHCARRVRL